MNLAQAVDAIPGVESSTDRATKFPQPLDGQKVYNRGNQAIEEYRAATGWSAILMTGIVASALGWFNVKDPAYGAKGDAVANDITAILAAVAAAVALSAGIIFFPVGQYKTTADVVVPPSMFASIILRGNGMRDTYIVPATNGQRGVLFGAAVPDASGVSTNNTAYSGMEDISVSGTLLTGGTSTGVQFTQMQKGWMRNVIIEAFDNAGDIGLYLRGSTTVGLNAPAAPHVWRCKFDNVLVATTYRPIVLENADENDFYNCNFGLPTGVAAGANSLIAMEFIQGRNNRFFGLLIGGDTDLGFRGAYVGMKFKTPTKGDSGNAQVYGLVAEGFNKPIWIESVLVYGTQVLAYNSSINAEDFDNAGYPAAFTEPNNGTVIQVLGGNGIYYCAGPIPFGHGKTYALAAGDNTPDLSFQGNVVAFTGNAAGSNVVSFTVPVVKSYRPLWVRLDALTTLVDASQTGGVNIRLWGRQNLVGATEMWVCLLYNGGTWYQLAPPLGATATAAFVFPVGVRKPIAFKNADYTLTPADHTIRVDASGAARTMTLPAAAGCKGQVYIVKKVDASANTVTVDANAAETIDGALTKVLAAQYDTIRIQSDGVNWAVI